MEYFIKKIKATPDYVYYTDDLLQWGVFAKDFNGDMFLQYNNSNYQEVKIELKYFRRRSNGQCNKECRLVGNKVLNSRKFAMFMLLK